MAYVLMFLMFFGAGYKSETLTRNQLTFVSALLVFLVAGVYIAWAAANNWPPLFGTATALQAGATTLLMILGIAVGRFFGWLSGKYSAS